MSNKQTETETTTEQKLDLAFKRISLKAEHVALMGVVAHLMQQMAEINNELARLEGV